VPIRIAYDKTRLELTSFGHASKPLPNTAPKKPHGMALIGGHVAHLLNGETNQHGNPKGKRRPEPVLQKDRY
jgi:hypothetical protein